ncbi:MAG: prolyl oligopeptidase family serine peptidase [bacterium]|nr:prolyl oligopeptidase family serine peptidase [bacterium]
MAIVVALWSVSCTTVTHRTRVREGQHPHSFRKDAMTTVRTDYLLYLPEGYETARKNWPLILFLHGKGERGSKLRKVAKHGPPKLIAKEAKQFPFVIVSPQCPGNDSWAGEQQVDTLNALLDNIVSQYRIDRERIYLTGLSMGGFGTWRLAAAYPDRFAAIAPVCGGGNPEDAASIAHLPVWVFHGEKDSTVPVKRSKEMVAALKKAGCRVKFTAYPNVWHDSWTATYKNSELYDWFLNHTRSGNEKYKTRYAGPGINDHK